MKESNSDNKVIGTIKILQDGVEISKPLTMSNIGKQFNDVLTDFFNESIKDAKNDYEKALASYNKENKSVVEDLVKLYRVREKSVGLIQKANDFLDQNNINAVIKNSVKIALSYTAVFRKIMELDIKGELPCAGEEVEIKEHYSASILTGLRAQDANLSIAASLGSPRAISTALSSILAVSAGALIAGPIGAIIGGITLLFCSFLQKERSDKSIQKLEEGTREIRAKLKIIKFEHKKLRCLIGRTKKMNSDLNDYLNCFEANSSEKEAAIIADACKLLGKIINETIEMRNSHE